MQWCLKLNLRGNSRGNLQESQGGPRRPDGGYSDQMVLGVVRQGGWTFGVVAKRHLTL